MEITGKVKKVFNSQTKGNFTFREMVITTNEQYPQDIIIQFTQDKVDLLDMYKPNDELKIFINIRGREWVNSEGEAKYFNTIQGWKIERPSGYNNINTNNSPINDENDDLPF